MTLLISVLEQGMIYAIMALGIYITYKILDFPDLTVDGSFPMGAAIAAVLISKAEGQRSSFRNHHDDGSLNRKLKDRGKSKPSYI